MRERPVLRAEYFKLALETSRRDSNASQEYRAEDEGHNEEGYIPERGVLHPHALFNHIFDRYVGNGAGGVSCNIYLYALGRRYCRNLAFVVFCDFRRLYTLDSIGILKHYVLEHAVFFYDNYRGYPLRLVDYHVSDQTIGFRNRYRAPYRIGLCK